MSTAGQKGMLLSGPRQTGKSTFVQWDLVPVLEEVHGAHVVYVDPSADREVDPAVSIAQVLREEVKSFDGIVMRMARGLGLTNIRLGGMEMDVAQAQSTYSKRTLGLLQALASAARRPVVIVLDEVQLCQRSDQARNLLVSLTRSAAKLSRERACCIRVLATGSHAHKLRAFVASKQEAFHGAKVLSLPLLGDGFVEWVANVSFVGYRPSTSLMSKGFATLLHRPQELLDVCAELNAMGTRSQPAVDQLFQLLVEQRAAEGREDLIAKLRSLSDVDLALVRVMAETGPRFAPHLAWCKKRTAALIEVMQGIPHSPALTTAEIDAALDRLVAKEVIWRGLGFAFEEPRYASWIMAMDPATDFCVEDDESPQRVARRLGELTFPAVLS